MKNLEQKVVDVKEDVTTLSEKSIAVADNYKPAVDTEFVEKKEVEKKEVKSLQKLIFESTANFARKRVTQLPYTEVKIENLTKNDRIAVMAKVIAGLQIADIESMEIAQNLKNPDFKVKVPIEGLNGIDFLREYHKLIQSLTFDAYLDAYKKEFKEGSEEYRKVALYQSSNLVVAPNPR